jgi:inhibitor of KinA
MMLEGARILPSGDGALLIELGKKIDPVVNERVMNLAVEIDAQKWPGVIETVPAYSSLSIYYNPLKVGRSELLSRLDGLGSSAQDLEPRSEKLVRIPVAYGGEFGPDLDFVASHNGIRREEVIRLHTGKRFRIYMLGFAPGFPYLGEVPKKIRAPRLPEPRVRVPAGSVGIAGSQTGIYPMELPGGWRIIGRTPVTVFDPQSPEFPYGPGDSIEFYAIGHEEFRAMGVSSSPVCSIVGGL